MALGFNDKARHEPTVTTCKNHAGNTVGWADKESPTAALSLSLSLSLRWASLRSTQPTLH